MPFLLSFFLSSSSSSSSANPSVFPFVRHRPQALPLAPPGHHHHHLVPSLPRPPTHLPFSSHHHTRLMADSPASDESPQSPSPPQPSSLPPLPPPPKEHTSGILVERSIPDDRIAELGIRSWPKWGCPPSKFPWTYDASETCYLVKGKVKVYPEGFSDYVEINAGDLAVLPKGLCCTWDVSVAVDKYYKFDP